MTSKQRNNKNSTPANGKVQIIPLGGVGEIGKNMFVLRDGNEILLIDAGLKFPDEEMFGIDSVIPNFSYLVENKGNISGVVLTHGHEDHIGALPYLLKEMNIPIYGSRLTLGLVEGKLREHNLLGEACMEKVEPGSNFKVGKFFIETFATNHSIPDSFGIAVETSAGRIVYTGDFKFDSTPVSGVITDYHKLAEIGKKGVLLALVDSTNAGRPGYTISEKEVGHSLYEIFRNVDGRIIIASFASNVYRIQQMFDVAEKYNRKVAVVGRSMVNVVGISLELGYLNIEKETLIDINEIGNYPKEKVVIITTGSQGEPMSALTRISTGYHRKVEIMAGDTVIISALPIPGNEKLVSRTIDNLFKRGANVIYEALSGVHVSGHASQEELKLMFNLLKPKFLIPVHGEYRHMVHQAKLAERVGIPNENVFLAEIGNIVEVDESHGKINGSVTSGQILVDGLGVGDVGNIVLRDRRILSQDGILIIVLTIDKSKNEVVAGPDVISRGFVYVRESEELLEEAKKRVGNTLNKMKGSQMNEWTTIKNNVKDDVGKFLWEKTGRRPMILPIIMEV